MANLIHLNSRSAVTFWVWVFLQFNLPSVTYSAPLTTGPGQGLLVKDCRSAVLSISRKRFWNVLSTSYSVTFSHTADKRTLLVTKEGKKEKTASLALKDRITDFISIEPRKGILSDSLFAIVETENAIYSLKISIGFSSLSIKTVGELHRDRDLHSGLSTVPPIASQIVYAPITDVDGSETHVFVVFQGTLQAPSRSRFEPKTIAAFRVGSDGAFVPLSENHPVLTGLPIEDEISDLTSHSLTDGSSLITFVGKTEADDGSDPKNLNGILVSSKGLKYINRISLVPSDAKSGQFNANAVASAFE